MTAITQEYIFDGSFEGLLTAIFYSFTCNEHVKITRASNFSPNLLSSTIEVKTEEDKYNRVSKSIKDKLSYNTLKTVYYLYLSDIDNVDTLIFKYLKLCFKYGDNINLAKNNDVILLVDKYYRRVSLEAHRFTGFVRFEEISNNYFYSKIEPDHNIISIISSHFTNRFSDQKFIIHDVKRHLALIYNTEEAIITKLSLNDSTELLSYKSPDIYESLWRKFYTSVNIDERYNPKLQKGFMPTRYWKHLTEFK